MKTLKIAVLAAVAIFLIACDGATQSAAPNDLPETVDSTQIHLEKLDAPR